MLGLYGLLFMNLLITGSRKDAIHIVCIILFLLGELSLLLNFQKGALDRTLIFRGELAGKRGLTFSTGGGGGECNFYIKDN